jgi:hypothetical protein
MDVRLILLSVDGNGLDLDNDPGRRVPTTL